MQPRPLGGWLMVFAFTLCLVAFRLFGSILMFSRFGFTGPNLRSITFIVTDFLQALGFLWAAYQTVFSKSHKALARIQYAMLGFGPIFAILSCFVLGEIFTGSASRPGQIMFRPDYFAIFLHAAYTFENGILSFFYCFIWTLYLSYSKRVKETFILP